MRIHFLILLALTCVSVCFGGTQARALEIQDIRFGAHDDKTRMVLDLSHQSDFRAFTLDGPYRLVIDLPRFRLNQTAVHKPENRSIRAVREGQLNSGVSRLVFDLNEPVEIITAFSLPGQQGRTNRLVLDFKSTSSGAFQTTKSVIHGTLDVENTTASFSVDAQPQNASLSTAPPPPKPAPRRKPLIVLDPGHGGADPGAIGANKVFEKTVALNLAKELRRQLEASGKYRVKMTRETDTYIKLIDRVKFARKNGADLFISIHADSLNRPNVRGASVYTLSETASDAQTARLAARENRSGIIAGVDLEVEDDEVANILVDLAMRDTMNQSNFFAGKLVDSFNGSRIKLLERPHRSAGFAVLKAPDIPSVLVEAGFMSNRHEADMLNRPEHRSKIASALKSGIDAYMKTAFENERM